MWKDIKNIYHLLIAVLANVFYGWPSKDLEVIGVSGTDGKTTTVNLIYHILKNTNFKVSMISSINAVIGDKKFDTGFHVTTPSSFAIQRFLKIARNRGTKYFILEVTSHALDQNRVWGVPFKIGVLTNVTNEHLDYHKTYRDYLKTKLKLLLSSKIAVVNRDDHSFGEVSKFMKKKSKKKVITYGMSENSSINPKIFPLEKTTLEGDFNKYNLLAAISACAALGVKASQIKKAIKSFKLPLGRLDKVYDRDFQVIVDFAHTPNAFLQLLSFLRPKVKGKIIHVFGAAGERDKFKRKSMGEISSMFSDFIVLTSEDPRSENADDIISQLTSGVRKTRTVYKIADRKKAIEFAMRKAKKGDLVLITGKAHEKSMNYGRGEEPWDEYRVVMEALRKL